MLMIDYRELSWWYWLLTACLLTVGVAGYPVGFPLAIALTVVQLVHFALREGNVAAFPVQVRFWYLVLLLVALPKPMQFIYWVPTIGTWAQLVFGYCTMARCVSLMPWNRKERLSLDLVARTFLSRPVRGNILHGLPPAEPAACESVQADWRRVVPWIRSALPTRYSGFVHDPLPGHSPGFSPNDVVR